MQYEVDVCSGCGLAHVRLAGTVTGEGLYEVLYEFAREGTWKPGRHDIWDLTAVRDLYIKPREADRLSALKPVPGEGGEQGVTAFVTRTPTQKAYGVVLFRSIRPFDRVRRSFRCVREATRWIMRRGPNGPHGISCEEDCLLVHKEETQRVGVLPGEKVGAGWTAPRSMPDLMVRGGSQRTG